jgi:hypothetical protein
MALQTPNIDVTSLFRVDELVAVITGGGSGEQFPVPYLSNLLFTVPDLCDNLRGV